MSLISKPDNIPEDAIRDLVGNGSSDIITPESLRNCITQAGGNEQAIAETLTDVLQDGQESNRLKAATSILRLHNVELEKPENAGQKTFNAPVLIIEGAQKEAVNDMFNPHGKEVIDVT